MNKKAFLIIFVFCSNCLCATLDSVVSIDSNKSFSRAAILFKDSISNHCKFITNNKVFKLDYIGNNYAKF